MKKQLTIREKVLMAVLSVLILVCVYNYVFYTPVSRELEALKAESDSLDDQLLMVQVQNKKLEQMKKELDAIMSGEQGEVKELPAYDNGKNVMNSLSVILQDANQYNVNFSSVQIEDHTVRRNINLSYTCDDYETAKKVFTNIYNGEYRCLISDIQIGSGNGYNITLSITYFEYK